MGCFSSKEKKSFRLEDVVKKSTLTSPANSRPHGLIISGLDSNKFLPLLRKPRNASSSKIPMFSRPTDVPITDVKCVNSVAGSHGNIISASKTGNDDSEEFPDEGLEISVRVTPSYTRELPIEQVSIYSPSTYVTPRFGSYGGLPIIS